jgi:hypothetical protein
MSIEWEEPREPQKRGSASWRKVAEELMENPERWARIYVGDRPGTANAIANRARKGIWAWKIGTFEATMRTDNGEYKVFARYIPDGSTDD